MANNMQFYIDMKNNLLRENSFEDTIDILERVKADLDKKIAFLERNDVKAKGLTEMKGDRALLYCLIMSMKAPHCEQLSLAS